MTAANADAAWRAWLDEFLSYVEYEKGLAANTVAAYRRDLETWTKFCGLEKLDPKRATHDDVT
ncbi:MAG TPA: site-specific integrase, partial [Actinomycetota bacterium]